MLAVDLNCDLGEGFGAWRMGDDAGLFPLVTSANLACGFHAGDAVTMLTGCRLALENGVAIGAHPGYRDLAGFGRRAMDVDPLELHAEVLYQVGALQALAASVGAEVRYVKPHGALYNRMVVDDAQAEAVARAAADAGLPLLGMPGSAAERMARQHGVGFVPEGYPDRVYLADGSLTPRSIPGAVLDDPDEIAARAVRLAVEGVIDTIDGGDIRMPVRSLCVHGDAPGAVAAARACRDALQAAGVELRAFA